MSKTRLTDLLKPEPEFYLDKLTRDNLVIYKAPANVTATGVGTTMWTYQVPNDGYLYQLLHVYARVVTNATAATRNCRLTFYSEGIEFFTCQDDVGIAASYTCNFAHSFMQGLGATNQGGYSSSSPVRTIGIPLILMKFPDYVQFGIQNNGQIGDSIQQQQVRLLKGKTKNAFGDIGRSHHD
jgi:hypothetical protein